MSEQKTISFLHSGEMGDIVASMATVKEICERENAKAVVYLDTTGGLESNAEPEVNALMVKQTNGKGCRFSANYLEFLKPLLEVQPYVAEVREHIPGSPVDYNLNWFRLCVLDPDMAKRTGTNLVFEHQLTAGLEPGYKGPWLTVGNIEVEPKHKYLVCRSTRYQSGHGFISSLEKLIMNNGGSESAFMGTEFEHEVFRNCFGWVPKRIPIKNALDAAVEITASKTFVANGTLFYWIAVGLGHRSILHELGVDILATHFPGRPPFVRYFMGSKFI